MVYLISLQLFWRKSKYRTQPNAKNTNAHFFNTVSTEIIIIIIITLWSYSDSELIGKKNREKILFFSYSIFSHSADDSLIAYLIESRSNLIRIFVEKNKFFFPHSINRFRFGIDPFSILFSPRMQSNSFWSIKNLRIIFLFIPTRFFESFFFFSQLESSIDLV